MLIKQSAKVTPIVTTLNSFNRKVSEANEARSAAQNNIYFWLRNHAKHVF